MSDDALMTAKEVAAMLHVTTSTLDRWRRESTGPEYLYIGRRVRYRRNAVEDWLVAGEKKAKQKAAGY